MSKFKREEAQAAVLLEEPVISSVLVTPINTFSFTKQAGTQLLGKLVEGIMPIGGAVGGAIMGAATGAAEALTDRKQEREQSSQLLPQMLLVVSQTQVAIAT